MKNHTTQHLHYDDTFGDCTYSFHISIIVLEIAHTFFNSTAPMTAHTVFHICRLHIQFSHRAMFFSFHLPFFLQFNSLPLLIVTAPKWNDTLTWLQFLVSTYLQFFSVCLGEIGFKLQLVLYKETKNYLRSSSSSSYSLHDIFLHNACCK